MRSTIKDVAKAAGVSVATVSRALNGVDNVLPETKQRITDAARALRFAPSGAARSLITRRTDTIGALLPDLHGEYFSELIRGIDQAARARGLHLLLSSSHGDAEEAAAALRAMNGRVDGLLVMSPHADASFLSQNLPVNLPAVLLNTAADLPEHSRFVVDNFGGAQMMTRHLVASGYKRIAFIQGPQENHEAQERLRGYRSGLGPDMPEMLFAGDFSEEAGAETGREIVDSKQRPDAIFAANDLMAIGCLGVLIAAGIQVPGEIAIAGFDDIPISRYVTPALSTVRVPIAALGAAALNALAQGMTSTNGGLIQSTVVAVELVLRHSCGAKKAQHAHPSKPKIQTASPQQPNPRHQKRRRQ